MVYSLPPFTSSNASSYRSLLTALDANLDDLQLGGYGISDTTLEEVSFYKALYETSGWKYYWLELFNLDVCRCSSSWPAEVQKAMTDFGLSLKQSLTLHPSTVSNQTLVKAAATSVTRSVSSITCLNARFSFCCFSLPVPHLQYSIVCWFSNHYLQCLSKTFQFLYPDI